MWGKPEWLNLFWQFLCERLSSFNPKGFYYSYILSCSLCEGRTSFAQEFSLENSADSYLCFWLSLLHSESYFFFLYQSPSLSLCVFFGSISSNRDEVLLINPSADAFVFGDINIHHKDWRSYSAGTNRSGKFCFNFFISNGLTQMVWFPTWIPDCDSHSPGLLDLFISDPNICFTMTFPQ